MSLYDISMIVIFLGAILFGYWKGLAWQVASVTAIFLSYFVAITFPDVLTPYISADPPLNRFAAMLILFIGTSLIVWTIFASVSKSLKKMELKGFDRQAGALLGAFKGAVLCMVVTMFAVSLLGESARNAISQSRSGYYVASGIDQLPAVLPTDMYAVIHQYVENFRDQMGDTPLNQQPLLEFGNQQQQTAGDDSQSSFPGQPPGSGASPWQTPASPAGYQSTPGTSGPLRGNYQSGAFNNTSGNSNTGFQQPSPWNSGGFRSGGNGAAQTQQPWQPPARTQQNVWSNDFPRITDGENGWPNVEFNVNSRELLQRGADAAIDAGRQWLNDQRK